LNITKTGLWNQISDDWLEDLIMCYVEKGILRILQFDKIKKTFEAIENRKNTI
jgi:hypothetical protein